MVMNPINDLTKTKTLNNTNNYLLEDWNNNFQLKQTYFSEIKNDEPDIHHIDPIKDAFRSRKCWLFQIFRYNLASTRYSGYSLSVDFVVYLLLELLKISVFYYIKELKVPYHEVFLIFK